VAALLIVEGPTPWPAQLLAALARHGHATIIVDEIQLVPFFVLAGGVSAVLIDARSHEPLDGPGRLRCREHSPSTVILAITINPSEGRERMTRQPIFTAVEKQRELVRCAFRNLDLDGVDLTGANLCEAIFEEVSLRGCDFRRADLRAASFLRCDLRGAKLEEVSLGGNVFHGSCLAGAVGLTAEQIEYIERRGGTFSDWPGGDASRLRLIK
jgi:hypothetical protein